LISEIIDLDNAWQDAIKRKDADALRQLAADDMVFTHGDCTVDDKERFMAHIMESQNAISAITSTDVAVRLYDNVAVVTCAVRQDYTRDEKSGQLNFRQTHVWICKDGRWQFLANQSTMIR